LAGGEKARILDDSEPQRPAPTPGLWAGRHEPIILKKLVAREAKISGREITIDGWKRRGPHGHTGTRAGSSDGRCRVRRKAGSESYGSVVPKSGQEMEEDSRPKAIGTARSVWEELFPETTCFWRSRMVGIWSGRSQRCCGLTIRGAGNVHRRESVSERDRIGPREQSSDGTKATIVPPTKRLTRTAAPDPGRR